MWILYNGHVAFMYNKLSEIWNTRTTTRYAIARDVQRLLPLILFCYQSQQIQPHSLYVLCLICLNQNIYFGLLKFENNIACINNIYFQVYKY